MDKVLEHRLNAMQVLALREFRQLSNYDTASPGRGGQGGTDTGKAGQGRGEGLYCQRA